MGYLPTAFLPAVPLREHRHHHHRVQPSRVTLSPRRPPASAPVPPRMGFSMPEIPEVSLPAPPTPETPMDPSHGESTAVNTVDSAPAASDTWLESVLRTRTSLHPTHPLAPLRAGADPLLSQMTLPHRRQEAWRFTDLRPVYAQRYTRASAASAPPASSLSAAAVADIVRRVVPPDAAATLVSVDGAFSPALSRLDDPAVRAWRAAGGHAGSISDFAGQRDRLYRMWTAAELGSSEPGGLFPTLGNALASDALVLHVPAGHAVERPVVVCFLSTGGDLSERAHVSAPRLAIIADEDASLTVLECHLSAPRASPAAGGGGDAPSASLALAGTAAALAAGASVKHYVLNDCARDAALLHSVHARLPARARYECRPLALGGRVGRLTAGVDIVGAGAHGVVHGATVADGRQVLDLHSRITHDCVSASSSQLQKNVVSGSARAVFAGRIVVTPRGDGTRSEQMTRSLLMSAKGQIDAMPVLEIETDDVECTHGVTVSDLHDDELFYLRSRGLSYKMAQALLVKAFVLDIMSECPYRTVQKLVSDRVASVSAAAQARQKEEAGAEYSSV